MQKRKDGFHSKTVETTAKQTVGQQKVSHEQRQRGRNNILYTSDNHFTDDHCFAKTNAHSQWNGKRHKEILHATWDIFSEKISTFLQQNTKTYFQTYLAFLSIHFTAVVGPPDNGFKRTMQNEENKQNHLTNRSVFPTSLRSMICFEEMHKHKLIIFYSYANLEV